MTTNQNSKFRTLDHEHLDTKYHPTPDVDTGFRKI